MSERIELGWLDVACISVTNEGSTIIKLINNLNIILKENCYIETDDENIYVCQP